MSGYSQAMARRTRRSRGMPVLLILQKHALPGIVLNRSYIHTNTHYIIIVHNKDILFILLKIAFSDIIMKPICSAFTPLSGLNRSFRRCSSQPISWLVVRKQNPKQPPKNKQNIQKPRQILRFSV